MDMRENVDHFVPIAAAVRASGVSRGTVLRWLKDPATAIRTEQEGRVRTVHLGDVMRHAGEKSDDDPDEFDDDEEEASRRVYGELVRALALSNKHVATLLEPFRKMGETYTAENAGLRTRVSELEQKLQERDEKMRELLSDEYDRRREEEREAREAKRLDDALDIVKQWAPVAVAGIAGHFGVTGAQEAVLVNAVAKLSDDQFSALISFGKLPPEAVGVLERIRATRKTNGSSTQIDNGTAAGDARTNAT